MRSPRSSTPLSPADPPQASVPSLSPADPLQASDPSLSPADPPQASDPSHSAQTAWCVPVAAGGPHTTLLFRLDGASCSKKWRIFDKISRNMTHAFVGAYGAPPGSTQHARDTIFAVPYAHTNDTIFYMHPSCADGVPADAASPELTHDGCLPDCQSRKSVILYDVVGRAGLLDRAFKFAALANVAGPLCAYVVVARPCELLAGKHNVWEGREYLVNCSLPTASWARRYLNLTFADGDPVLRGAQWRTQWLQRLRRRSDASSEPLPRRIGPPRPDSFDASVNQPVVPTVDQRNASALRALHVQLRAQWAAAAAAARKGIAFEWRLADPLWQAVLARASLPLDALLQKPSRAGKRQRLGAVLGASTNAAAFAADGRDGREGGTSHERASTNWRQHGSSAHTESARQQTSNATRCPWPPSVVGGTAEYSASPAERACVYVRHHPASLARELSWRFEAALGLIAGRYNALHIRRRDKADPHVCNTTIARVVEIARGLATRPPRVVIFTDDLDPTYGLGLQQALAAAVYRADASAVVLGEAVMRSLARRHDPSQEARGRDNFLVFAAELEVFARATTSVHICTTCPRGGIEACVTPAPKLAATKNEHGLETALHSSLLGTRAPRISKDAEHPQSVGSLMPHWGG